MATAALKLNLNLVWRTGPRISLKSGTRISERRVTPTLRKSMRRLRAALFPEQREMRINNHALAFVLIEVIFFSIVAFEQFYTA
jgi:hypothetical protein